MKSLKTSKEKKDKECAPPKAQPSGKPASSCTSPSGAPRPTSAGPKR